MKKRFVCFILAALTCLSLAIPASAAETPLEDNGVTRAVSIPTQMAPASWYDTVHYWTARYYTYSSYIFTSAGKELWVDLYAPEEFSVDFVSTDGKYDTYTVESVYFGSGRYAVQADVTGMTFYMVINNESSTPILSNATYSVYHPEGHSVRSSSRVVIANVANR